MRYGGFVGVLALGMAGCGGSGDPGPTPSASATAGKPALQAPSEAAQPVPEAVPGRTEKVQNDTYAFAYSYPSAAASIPGLRALLDRQLVTDRSNLVSSATSGKTDAEKDGYPYHAYERQTEWKVVTNLPDWLSLSSEHFEYSGGAHGMTVSEALLWDRRAETARKPIDLFASHDALRLAIQAPFCDILDQQRGKKRGEPVQRSGEMFTECINPIEQTIILGSSNGRTFNRIGVLVPPYNAGPYAEGSYDVTLPVTGKVMAALKPQYRGAFSIQ